MSPLLALARDGEEEKLTVEYKETHSWLKTAILANQPYTAPDGAAAAKGYEDYPCL